MHILAPDRYELREKERVYFELLKKTFAIIAGGSEIRTRAEIHKMVSNLVNPNVRPTSAQLIRDAENVFGRLQNVNKEVQAGIYRDTLLRLAHYCEEEKDYEQVRLIIKDLRELDGIDKREQAEFEMQLPDISFTTDPKVLEFEEAEYEEE